MKIKKYTYLGKAQLWQGIFCIVAGLVLVGSVDAGVQVIVSDNFDTMTAGESLTGRPPDVDLPVSNWVTATFSTPLTEQTGYGASGSVGGYAHGSAILLDSSGSYYKPTTITISADIRVGGVTGYANGTDMRGMGLGFYKGVDVHASPLIFAQGLMLDQYGNLNLQNDYTFQTAVAYAGGTFDANEYYTLTYTVDLATGHILDIDLEGSTADYSSFYSTTLFSDANTKYAGLYVSSSTANRGQFDDLSVTTVIDEPAGDVIVSDNFNTVIEGAELTGRTPDVSLPGSIWVVARAANKLKGAVVGANMTAEGLTLAASAVSLASAGSYTKPTRFTISAEIRVNAITGNASDRRGVFLGYFHNSLGGSGDPRILSRGLILDIAGNLTVMKDTTAATPVAYAGGTFDPTTFYRLSFEVDTTTGDILDIDLEGSTADYSSLYDTDNWFSDLDTMYAGLYVASTSANRGQFDNFWVETPHVPAGTVIIIK